MCCVLDPLSQSFVKSLMNDFAQRNNLGENCVTALFNIKFNSVFLIETGHVIVTEKSFNRRKEAVNLMGKLKIILNIILCRQNE